MVFKSKMQKNGAAYFADMIQYKPVLNEYLVSRYC